MIKRTACLSASIALGLGLAFGSMGAQAAPILGSNVDSSVFSATIGSTSGWSYLGQSTTAFSGTGTASLVSRSSSYSNSFGFANTSHADRVQLFGSGAAVGSTALVSGYAPGYLFYYQANGSDLLFFSDDNRQYTDGVGTGGNPGWFQGDIDIFMNASLSTWAFFLDDAGGGTFIAGDDGDYDDMVVTFQQESPAGVPEPGTLALLGMGMLGLGALRRRKAAVAA
jgi:hypothetical protein